MWIVVIAVSIPSFMALVAWVCYLRFCRFVIKHTNDPASLRDVAIAARAYRAAGFAQLGQALGRMVRLPRGSG